MSPLEIVALVLIAIGAVINFLIPPVIKKKSGQDDSVQNKIYVTKSFGLVLVIVGCIIFFWLGGKFGV